LVALAASVFVVIVSIAVFCGDPVGAHPPFRCTVQGNSSNNVLFGTFRNDIICALRGRDIVNAGQGGHDHVWGGKGKDILSTVDGKGNDVLSGGKGNDRCSADRGDRVKRC
jgi:Ca2+-binding RTX toxin-like protein